MDTPVEDITDLGAADPLEHGVGVERGDERVMLKGQLS